MIKLSKTGITYVTDHYRPDCEKYVEVEVDRLHPYLHERVELSDDFTLEDFFKILERETADLEKTFTSALGHYPLQLYIDEIKKPRPEKYDGDEIAYLELWRYGELESWGDNLELVIDFHGIGKEHDMGASYAIEFTPLNELKHLPLRLRKEFKITGVIMRKSPTRGSFLRTYAVGTTTFTVYEMISEILCELSFAGSPEQRDETIAKITKDVKEMKKTLGED